MIKYSVTAFILFLSACSNNPYIDYTEYKNGTVVYFHGGGDVQEVAEFIDRIKKPIKIKGNCGSACTLSFKYSDTCVFENAKIVFHAIQSQNKTISFNDTLWYLNELPYKMKKYFLLKILPYAEYTKLTKRKDYIFNGREMHQKLDVKYC